MGVNHLRRDAATASGGSARGNIGGSPDSDQTSSGSNFKRPAETSGTTQVPEVSSVNSFDRKSVKPGNRAKPEPFGGPRAGAKSGQEKVGTRKGNERPMSGGSMY